MRKTLSCLVIILMLGVSAQAEVVALKRDPGLTHTDPLGTGDSDANQVDARFAGLDANDVVPTTVNDAQLYPGTWAGFGWRNYGTTLTLNAGSGWEYGVYRFDLSALGSIGTVNLAELRLYITNGNTGNELSRVLTDWSEGNKDGDYPGLEPAEVGCGHFHPNGLQTGEGQFPDGSPDPNPDGTGTWADGPFGIADYDMSRVYKAGANDRWHVWDVTDIVQSWADGTSNYGFSLYSANYSYRFSEAGTQEQPVLFLDCEMAAPPTDITDLATSTVDWWMVELTWTAPTDAGGPGGAATVYDIRYSTSPIDAGNFDSATQCTGEPTPASPSTPESFDVTGLDPDTLYYFAIKSGDAGGLWSNLSNVVSATTLVTDAVAPDAVSDLATSDLKPNRITLNWTAVGDDGATGTASEYDIRYSDSLIDAGNFASAIQCAGEPAPQAAGNAETFDVTGLSPETQYWFAMKVADELPNWSGISNVPSATTAAPDTTPPTTVADLSVVATNINTADLTWTAPSDPGSGVGTYDVRYSTFVIDEGNWASASQATGEPTPSSPSSTENFTVTGLNPATEYYFALKSDDLAEPPNTSAISNVPSGTTKVNVSPVTVQNPWIVNNRVADCRTMTTIANTFVNSYQPDGVTPPADDQAKAINCYDNYKRRTYHWAYQPPDMLDTVNVLNNFGWVLCGRHAAHNCTILSNVPGMGHRQIGLPGHWVYEANYDGAWHQFCTMTTLYTYNRAVPPAITSCAEYDADESLVLDAVAEGRACPGFLLCGDSPEWYADVFHSWWDGGSGVAATDHSMDMNIRIGEAVDRTWEAWDGQTFDAGVDANYHHEAQHDWKDYINYPYWEPYGAVISYIDPAKTTYRRWANGTLVLQPDFRSPGYQASVESSSNISTYNEDSLTPDLHLASTGSAEVIFKIDTPFMLTGGTINGTFYRNDAGDATRLYISTNGSSYTQIWDNGSLGTTVLSDLSLDSYLWGGVAAASIPVPFGVCWIKVELDADGAITDAGVSDLEMNIIFHHNKGAMAYLDKGQNDITVTLDNPQDLDGAGASFRVTYKWKEYDGADWTIDKSQVQYITTSPTNFTITTGGSKVPRTESVELALTAPPSPDGTPPGAISDLDALNPDATTIDLTFTAPGDDGFTGRATWYDARYNTVSITEGNWDSCTEVVGEPAPQAAGNTEYFTVSGLDSSTTYYFAIRTYDEGNQGSDLSNVDSETTQPPDVTAPAAITDLAAVTAIQSGSVDLTWTAQGDDGSVGTAESYDLRYSTSVIDAGNFASATQATGVPAPQSSGSPESFTVTGLSIGQTYYFAIKSSDEVPNVSAISNVPSATAQLGEMTLQGGGVTDNYMSAYNADLNYGGFERMIVTGYEDQGATNRQRGLVKFDLGSIPTGTPITTAMLYLYSYEPTQVNGSTGFYGAHRLTTDWSGSSSTWNSPWTTPGGDFEATADATAPKQAVANVWYAFNVTTRVQQWIDSGGTGNYGWLIKCTDEMLHNQDYFYQTDTSNAQYRPKLFISDLDPDETPPADITDLAAATGAQSASVDLSWTAPGDDGSTGTATSYDVRYSAATITEGNWDSATPVSGAPAPSPAGSPESFTATGLPTGVTLYFAIKTSDEMLNESGLSNVPSADSLLGLVILQEGLDGYTGTVDNSLSAGSPDSNYGVGWQLLRVHGWEDVDPNNRMRGLIKFDLTGIAAGSVITNAKVCLYSSSEAIVTGDTGYYGAYRATTAWTESGSSWNNSDTGVPWTTGGGDFEATPDATSPKQAVALVWYEFDVTTRVQDWIDNPANNLGWIIKCTDEMLHNQDDFYQSDALDDVHRAKLVIRDTDDYLVSTAGSPQCTGEVTGGGVYGDGQTCYVSAVPFQGNTFVDWTGGPIDGSTNPDESFIVTGDVEIAANFQTDVGYISVCDYATLSDAVSNLAVAGDIILVQPGVYQMNEGRLSVYNSGEPGNPITVRGVMQGNQRPICEPAPAQEVNRGFFHFWTTDQYWVVENLEFRNLRGFDVLYSANAAGCYITGDDITIRNCYFHDNDQGISGAEDGDNTVVEFCEFYNNGSDLNLGYTHGIYMNNESQTIRGCYFHDGYGGMLFKTRAGTHVLEYNWLETDGSEAFVAAASSDNANNGLWRGNVFIKRSTPGGQRRILSFCDSPSLLGTMSLINNTVISATTADIYIASSANNQCDLVLKNNVFVGPSDDLFDWQAGGTISGNNNVFRTAMSPDVPGGVVDSIFSDNPGFADLGGRDFHLLDTSDCRDAGLNNPTWLNESDQWVDGTPQYEPTKTLSLDTRQSDATLDIGAYEYYVPGLPTVEFDLTASSGDESVTPANLAVSLSASYVETVTVDYAVTGGDAISPDDYTISGSQLTFDPGVTTQNVVLTIVDDGDVESDETVQVTLSSPSNANLGSTIVHTYTINDNDVALPTVEFDLTVSNGDESVTPANLSVSLSASSTDTVTVDYAVSGGTAVDPDDYTISGTQLTFNPGVTTQDVVVTIVDDGDVEGDETVQVTLSSPSNATLGGNTMHTYTINDNDVVVPDVEFDLTSSNGDESVTPANLAVSLSESTTVTVTVDYAVSGGTAVDPDDYTISGTQLTFAPGVTTQNVVLTIVNDGLVESDETVQVTLSSPSNATLGANTVHTYTINDNDVLPTVEFDLTVSNGDESVTPANLAVSLSGSYVETVTVNYAVSGGTAVDPDDYTISGTQLTFDPGVTTQNVVLTIVDDGIVESDETVQVTLSSPSNATLGGNTVHTYTINNDDSYPVVEFDLVSSNGDESVTPVNLVVSLDASYDETVTVDYAVTGGTAVDPDDYTISGTQLTFDPGVTTQNVVLTIVNDGDVESDETVEVTLSSPSNATLGGNTVHTYSINDNDGVSPPGQASNPSPADGATKVALSGTILSWTAGSGADSHDVYFGTNPTPGPSELQGNQTDTTFPLGYLAKNTWYYWRIDEVNDGGTTTGVVWSFRSGAK